MTDTQVLELWAGNYTVREDILGSARALLASSALDLSAEQERFEAQYAVKWNEAYGNKTTYTAADVKKLREGNSYGEDRTYLNAMWEGWQAGAALNAPATPSAEPMPTVKDRARQFVTDFTRGYDFAISDLQ